MNRLQQLREIAALSRADLARRADVTQSVIGQLEAGAHLTEAERAVEIPGETSVEDIAVILNKLADALGANLISKGIAVTPGELLGPASGSAPAPAQAAPDEETQTALPLIGVNYAHHEGDLPPDARSHNETETPNDIDAALAQLARDAQITASEAAAETGVNEVSPQPDWPNTPVSPAAETGPGTAPDFTAPPSTGQAPTGGTETINMAELPDTLPIGVLPDSAPVVKTQEISPLADQPQDAAQPVGPDHEFASQETQEIYIPPEVRASLPTYNKPLATDAEPAPVALDDSGNPPDQQFELPQDIERMPSEAETIDTPSLSTAGDAVTSVPAEAASDAPTQQFDTSAVRPHHVKDTTELEKSEQPPNLTLAGEPSSVVMAEDAAVEAASPDVIEEPEVASDAYEAVPMPEMPGPAPAPETMEATSEAHPEPPDMAEVEREDRAFENVPAPAATLESAAPPANLGLETAHAVEAVPPNPVAPPVPPVPPTSVELEAATPAQDDAPLTKSQPEKQPDMQPYVTPQPSAAEQSRYKLPPSTVIPSIIGVVAALGWYAWRSWRRAKAESERVAPYNKKK